MSVVDKYSDNRSFKELVNDTIADSKYDSVVENILRDKESGWKLNYYKPDGKSSCDPELARMYSELKQYNINIDTNKKLISKLTSNIKLAILKNKQIAEDRILLSTMKEEKDVETKCIDIDEPVLTELEFKSDVLKTWKSQIAIAEEEIKIDISRTKELESKIPKWEWNRVLELSLDSNLQRVRNQFVIDNNEELLRKGVSWACNYAYKNRYELITLTEKII